MGKDPAFLFYTSDFVLDTLFMSFEDRGKLITLLCHMHQHGRLTEEQMIKTANTISDDLKTKFKIDKNGLWYNERLEDEIKKRKRFSASCTRNGKRGGRPVKKVDTKPTDTSFEKFWKMYDKPTEEESCKVKWAAIPENEQEQIFSKLPAYIAATPEKQFRKNPLTYLTRKIWLDELVPELPQGQKKSAFELLVETGKYE